MVLLLPFEQGAVSDYVELLKRLLASKLYCGWDKWMAKVVILAIDLCLLFEDVYLCAIWIMA